MSELRIGRFLLAGLHQAIAELLPDRLEFYESWLSVTGLREGTIGVAPLMAALSFLRMEGEMYSRVTTRAGEYAAEWTVNGLPSLQKRLIVALPVRMRARLALRTVRQLVNATYSESRAIVRLHKDASASVDLRGSPFCRVRDASPRPLCDFYAAAIARVLQRFHVPADLHVDSCRAASRGEGCLLSVMVRVLPEGEPAPAP